MKTHNRAVIGEYQFKPVEVLHLKSGVIYIKLGVAINATNGIEGNLVIYERNGILFAREEEEFEEKFSELP